MGVTKLQRETFSAWYAEALPLLRRHWQELARWKDIPLDVDIQKYQAAERRDILRLYTARRDGDLVGYALYFVGINQHYRSSMQAIQDVFYVDPTRRGSVIGLRLTEFADAQLAAEGVQIVIHHVKVAHPELGALLAHTGYEHLEQTWMKRLDVATPRRRRARSRATA